MENVKVRYLRDILPPFTAKIKRHMDERLKVNFLLRCMCLCDFLPSLSEARKMRLFYFSSTSPLTNTSLTSVHISIEIFYCPVLLLFLKI